MKMKYSEANQRKRANFGFEIFKNLKSQLKKILRYFIEILRFLYCFTDSKKLLRDKK